MKPSDFPRDLRFRTPGPAFIENGTAHLRSYNDVLRVMLDNNGDEFSQDISYWAPVDQRIHLNWYFLWATGKKKANGDRYAGLADGVRQAIFHFIQHKAEQLLKQL